VRDHDVTALTTSELERAKRELSASLALTRPGSPMQAPTLTQLQAIDGELEVRRFSRERARLMNRLPVHSDPWRG
jgi:hypothetical protein